MEEEWELVRTSWLTSLKGQTLNRHADWWGANNRHLSKCGSFLCFLEGTGYEHSFLLCPLRCL
jgi:hypothetical protein